MTRVRFLTYLRFLALFMAFFIPMFVIGGWLGGRVGERYALHLPFENSLPFWPEAVWGYLSLYPIFLLPLFHLTAEHMDRLGRQSCFMLLVAAPFYVFFPGLNSFPQPEVTGFQGMVIDTIREVDTLHNLVPSLHIAFAWLIVMEVRRQVGDALGSVYFLWAVVITVSTVLLHRHYMLDLVSGIALALAARHVFSITRFAGAVGR